MTTSLADILSGHLAAGTPAARVIILSARGSTPREAGATMVVIAERVDGTIGGGHFEWIAIAEARALLATGLHRREMDVPLGPAIGQCCGGHITLLIERAGAQTVAALHASEALERAGYPHILIFGAGFVGRALATALSPLPFKVRLIDGRAAEFAGFTADGITNVVTDHSMAEVEAAPANAAYLIMTHSHSLDALVATAVLERADFGYLGIIGSRTKRKRFEAAFREQGISHRDIARITCPIGSREVRDKRPAVIAALAAAELVNVFAAPTASLAWHSEYGIAPGQSRQEIAVIP